ncbi:Protein F23C8.9 [Aphelenchoides avenae]|nr:Protein F23C8.9 [Aphelenchus avenae]
MDDEFDGFYESEAEEAEEAPEAEEEGDGTAKDEAKAVEEALKKSEAEAAKKKRQATQKPRPKLNELVLTSEKGLRALREQFQDWQVKSSNPYDNLNDMMKKMEYWAHTVYPQLTFDDFLSRAEQLGKKRPVRVQMMKMRMGVPLGDGVDPEAPAGRANEPSNAKGAALDEKDDFYDDDFDLPQEQPPSTGASSAMKKAAISDDEGSDLDDFLRNVKSQTPKNDEPSVKQKPSTEPAVKSNLSAKRAQIQAMLKRRTEKPSPAPKHNRRAILSDVESDDEGPPVSTLPLTPTENIRRIQDSDEDSDSSMLTPAKRAKSQATPGRRVILSDDEEGQDSQSPQAVENKVTENLLNEDDVMDTLFAT